MPLFPKTTEKTKSSRGSKAPPLITKTKPVPYFLGALKRPRLSVSNHTTSISPGTPTAIERPSAREDSLASSSLDGDRPAKPSTHPLSTRRPSARPPSSTSHRSRVPSPQDIYAIIGRASDTKTENILIRAPTARIQPVHSPTDNALTASISSSGTIAQGTGLRPLGKRQRPTHFTISEDCSDERRVAKRRLLALRDTAPRIKASEKGATGGGIADGSGPGPGPGPQLAKIPEDGPYSVPIIPGSFVEWPDYYTDSAQTYFDEEDSSILDENILDNSALDSSPEMPLPPSMHNSWRESLESASELFSPKTEDWQPVEMQSAPSNNAFTISNNYPFPAASNGFPASRNLFLGPHSNDITIHTLPFPSTSHLAHEKEGEPYRRSLHRGSVIDEIMKREIG